MPIDLATLWDYHDPALSEQRFAAALENASPDEALILKTQIARTHGLRRDFPRALEILDQIAADVADAGPEARVRLALERGRCHSSAAHSAESQTPEARERARAAFTSAFEMADSAGLDDLAIDALHMMTFVDTAPELQLEWNRKALAHMQASSQPAARKWDASLHNNTGYSLHQLGRYDEALSEFQLALKARERMGDAADIRVAHWMIAWTLRALGRLDEALAIQLRLEAECEQAGEPDPYVFEELELLYKALGDQAKADHYAALRSNKS